MKLITVIVLGFFLSFTVFTVPAAHATVAQATFGRLAFRAFAPSLITAASSPAALFIGAVGAAGLAYYLVYKTSAVDTLKSWWSSPFGPGNKWPAHGDYTYGTGGRSVKWTYPAGPGVGPDNPAFTVTLELYIGGAYQTGWSGYRNNYPSYNSLMTSAWANANSLAAATNPVPTDVTAPVTPTDYNNKLSFSPPVFPANSIYGTPGSLANLTGNENIITATPMTSSDADSTIKQLGMTPIDTTNSTQANPTTGTDNAGTNTGLELAKLNDIYMMEGRQLVELQAINVNTKTGDNASTFPQSAQRALDCTVTALTTSTATSSSLSVRIAAVKALAITKFPFSLFASYDKPDGITFQSSEISMPDIVLPNGAHVKTSFPIDINPLVDKCRSLMSWVIIAATAAMIIRRGLSI
jgi:hypothetical protein